MDAGKTDIRNPRLGLTVLFKYFMSYFKSKPDFLIKYSDQYFSLRFLKLYFIILLLGIFTYIIFKVTLDIGYSTSHYGSPYDYQKTFRITEDEFYLRYEPNSNSKAYTIANKNEEYIVKGKERDWLWVDPVFKDASAETANKRQSELKDGNIYIIDSSGVFISPFQRNLEKFLLSNNINTKRDHYNIGPFLTFLSTRSNTYYIYVIMLSIFIVYIVIVCVRIRYLFINYNTQTKINSLLFNSPKKASALQNHIKSLPSCVSKHYISDINETFLSNNENRVHEVHQDYIDNEESQDYLFKEKLRRSNVWIIRSGIFGTLVGLVIAFFELYLALYNVHPGKGQPLTEEFIHQIRQALLGNSIAVATSITAHGITLFIEMFIGSLVLNESLVQWIRFSYKKMINLKLYQPTPKAAKDVLLKAYMAFNETAEVLTDINKQLHIFQPKTEEINDQFAAIILQVSNTNISLNEFESKLKEATGLHESYVNNGKLLNETSNALSESIVKTADKIESLNLEAIRLRDYIDDNVSTLESITSDVVVNIQKILDSLSHNFNSIRTRLNHTKK